jgi:hypothetical protein
MLAGVDALLSRREQITDAHFDEHCAQSGRMQKLLGRKERQIAKGRLGAGPLAQRRIGLDDADHFVFGGLTVNLELRGVGVADADLADLDG